MKMFVSSIGARYIYNLTNTPFFGSAGAVSTNLNAATFGKVTAAADPRVVQMGLKLIF